MERKNEKKNIFSTFYIVFKCSVTFHCKNISLTMTFKFIASNRHRLNCSYVIYEISYIQLMSDTVSYTMYFFCKGRKTEDRKRK